METLKRLAQNISDKDRRTLDEIKEQVKDARLEQKNVINFPITRVAFDRLYSRILSIGLDIKFINPSGTKSSYMEIRF